MGVTRIGVIAKTPGSCVAPEPGPSWPPVVVALSTTPLAILSAALGPAPVFRASENVTAMLKLSALAELIKGFAVSAVPEVPKLNTYVEATPEVVFAALATPPFPSSAFPERSVTAVPTVNVYVVLVESPAEGEKCAVLDIPSYVTVPVTTGEIVIFVVLIVEASMSSENPMDISLTGKATLLAPGLGNTHRTFGFVVSIPEAVLNASVNCCAGVPVA